MFIIIISILVEEVAASEELLQQALETGSPESRQQSGAEVNIPSTSPLSEPEHLQVQTVDSADGDTNDAPTASAATALPGIT